MKTLMSKRVGIRTIISGSVLTAIGFVALMLNVFNVYGKASTNCFNNSNCNVSNNLLIAHVGVVAFVVGLVFVAFGIVVLIASSKNSK